MRRNKQEEYDVEIEVTVEAETKRALLVNDGKIEVWVAKSLVRSRTEAGKITTLLVPEWLAADKGLV